MDSLNRVNHDSWKKKDSNRMEGKGDDEDNKNSLDPVDFAEERVPGQIPPTFSTLFHTLCEISFLKCR